MARPITVSIETRTFDRVSVAYTQTPAGPVETGRVYVRDQLDSGYWYVWGLYVRPGYRRQGIGRQIMDEVISVYGFDRLELIPAREADEDGLDSDQLTAWYQQMGFKTGPSANTSRKPRPSDDRRMYRTGARGV